MKKQRFRNLIGLIAAAGLLSAAQSAQAVLTFTLNGVINGGTPTSTAPWLTATFINNGSGGVALTLTSSLNVASEFIDEVGFNVRSTITPSAITVVNTSPLNPEVTSVAHTTQDAQDVNGSGNMGKGFDFLISWSSANAQGGVKRFNGADVETFSFTFMGLTEADFNFANANGVLMGAHVQGIPGTTGPSSAIGVVPEPTTMLAGAMLLLPFAASTVRRLRKNRTV